MATFQLNSKLPMLTLDQGCTITVEAIDPDTGAAVSGVLVSQVTLYAANDALTEPAPDDETTPEFALDPALVNTPG